jgi:DNA-binding transcriptional regulator YhcF (GntR family)
MTEQTTKTRRGIETYATNPFLQEFEEETKKRPVFNKVKDSCLTNLKTGEMQEVAFTTYKEVSADKFVKIYLDGVRQLTKLNGSGAKIFEILFKAVQGQIGKDWVFMSYKSLAQESVLGISQATYDRGIRELREKGFIKPTNITSCYWINPRYLYNGDRLRLITVYRKQKESTDQIILNHVNQTAIQTLLEEEAA